LKHDAQQNDLIGNYQF